jgi:hypothetical protein
MVEDIDIWRTANLLLRQHGHDAPLIAAQRRDRLSVIRYQRFMFAADRT